MPAFAPVNSIETRLRAMLEDKHTLSWSFYTPLAAAELWIIARNHPEDDGDNRVRNPEVCIFQGPEHRYIGIYTAHCRVEEVFAGMKLSARDWTAVAAPGYQLLTYLKDMDAALWMNACLKECQYHLDPDMVEILLSRPEPTPAQDEPRRQVDFKVGTEVKQHLGPLREFLGKQRTVRAAWISAQEADSPLPAGHRAYEIGLVMEDPEDRSLLDQVRVMAKALTPVEMEWTSGVLLADDRSLRNLAKQQPPFYEAPDFLKKSRHGH